MPNSATPERNHLFPIFLKLDQFNVLLVGAGAVGLEKLTALLQNAPATSIRIVARIFHPEVITMAAKFEGVKCEQRDFEWSDLDNVQLVITALNDTVMSKQIFDEARRRRIFINSADKPDLCDFYLGAIVQKGNLKIAISTNGKSPTLAKRLKEWLIEVIPNEVDDLLENLRHYRSQLKGDLKHKVQKLDLLTRQAMDQNGEK